MSAAAIAGGEDWIRSEVDEDKALSALRAAERMLLSDDRSPTLPELVFVLFEEAAKTERAIRKPGPRGHVSCMPEVYHTAKEIFTTEVAMIADNITYPPDVKHPVSAEAAGRYMEVVKWLRFAKGRDRKQSKELLWLLAQNIAPGAVARITGYPTARAALMAKTRRLNEIAERLRKNRSIGREFYR